MLHQRIRGPSCALTSVTTFEGNADKKMPTFQAFRRLSSDFRNRLSLSRSASDDKTDATLSYATPAQLQVSGTISNMTTSASPPSTHLVVNDLQAAKTQPKPLQRRGSRRHVAITQGSTDPEEAVNVYVEDQISAEETEEDERPKAVLGRVPAEVWDLIASQCSPATAASLAIANKSLAMRIGAYYWRMLDETHNFAEKLSFMEHMDRKLPGHLLCYSCGAYHLRQPDRERLQSRPTVLQCPTVGKTKPPPSMRLTTHRKLAFSLVQLVTRASRYNSSRHGIASKALSSSWTDYSSDWKHKARFQLIDGHLLMRVRSRVRVCAGMAPSEMRLLLLDRIDYAPYFSTCKHWADESTLTSLCKCALKHIPAGRATQIPGSCAECRPLRRCFHCPTEYHIQVHLSEGRDVYGGLAFYHELVVTRWSDLGDGRSPLTSREWLACNGEQEYESMQRSGDLDGARTLRRRFESRLGERVPEARALPLRRKQQWKSTNRWLWTEEQVWMEEHDAAASASRAVLGGGKRLPHHFN